MTSAVVSSKAELSRVVDKHRKDFERNSGWNMNEPEWDRLRPRIVETVIENLPDGPGNVVFDLGRISVSNQFRGFEGYSSKADPELVRNNPELSRAIDKRRRAIARRSAWSFTDDEWDQVQPEIVTALVDNLPDGNQIEFGDLAITVSRAPKSRKTIDVQRRPDGSSTAVITEY